jgi:CBS domain-containing protein
MEDMVVKDIMIPLDEYATVPEDATLYQAIMALEEAQLDLDRTRYKYLHRAVLVIDGNRKVVGKVSQLDALSALEPKYANMGDTRAISRAGFSTEFLKDMIATHALWALPIEQICAEAAHRKVKEIMYTPTEGEYIDENASIPEAVHHLIVGHHHSLIVTRGEEIVGVLRTSDVFAEVFQVMKALDF